MVLSAPAPFCRHPSSFFNEKVEKMPVSSVYEATENELRGSRMTISNLLKGVFKVIDFEITACTPTSMLMLKILMLQL
jgi:hypothetical protein